MLTTTLTIIEWYLGSGCCLVVDTGMAIPVSFRFTDVSGLWLIPAFITLLNSSNARPEWEH